MECTVLDKQVFYEEVRVFVQLFECTIHMIDLLLFQGRKGCSVTSLHPSLQGCECVFALNERSDWEAFFMQKRIMRKGFQFVNHCGFPFSSCDSLIGPAWHIICVQGNEQPIQSHQSNYRTVASLCKILNDYRIT